MKKFLVIIVLSLFFVSNIAKAGSKWGEGELQLTRNIVDYFIQFIRGKGNKRPANFYVTLDGTDATYWYCGAGDCRSGSSTQDINDCERLTKKKCKQFAFKRTIRWKNDINPAKGKASTINSKWSDAEIYAKLTELGFYNNDLSKKIEPIIIKKKESKKIVKKYELKGERSIALSWEGYEDLIAGTVEFDEADYKGTLNIPLPNNDGNCNGNYLLQEGGKGTWQIVCSNNIGAAGTLKWTEKGGVIGKGRDHNDMKVRFTVSKKS